MSANDESSEERCVLTDTRRSSTNTITSRTSAASVIDSTRVEEILKFLQKGSELTKVKSKSSTYRRYYYIHRGIQLKYENEKKSKDEAVYISDVRDVLDTPSSDGFNKVFRSNPDFADRSCCFSIVIGDKRRTLDLIASDVATKSLWVTGLRHLKMTMDGKAGEQSERMRLYMREIFQKADRNGDETLNFKEVVKLMQILNVPVDVERAKRLFQEADTSDSTKDISGQDCLNEEEFMKLHFLLTKRHEIDALFLKYSHNGKFLTPEELEKFFYEEQGHKLTEDECSQLIRENEPSLGKFTSAMLTSAGFNTLMDSAVMDIKRLRCRSVYQDMDQPLSHYFIESSHNTYLSSNQLVGDSSVECYITALKSGCRCVELDVWDGDNGEPIIYHGHTLTSKILLRDALVVCNIYAFETSPYPVILSIENHCSLDQQRVMARYLKEIFKDSLLTEDVTSLPSPNQLMRKIIVKNFKLPPSSRNGSDGEVESEGSDEESERSKEKPRHKMKLAQELSDCVVICQSSPFKGFDAPLNKEAFKYINSLSEGKAASLAETKGNALVRYTTKYMCRVYPSATRASSSNYDPVPVWVAGCQVVALNYQTADEAMYVNKGMFEDNGRSGYVLKPSFMREPNTDYDCSKRFYSDWRRKLNLTIISGYQLPKKRGDKAKSILDPFVVVDILGLKADRQTDKTKTIENNGFNPLWNRKMSFTITCPHLALVLFRVYDAEETSKDVVVAQYCLPFRCMQQGYRTVHLKSKHHEPLLMSSLFVKVEILRDTPGVDNDRSSKESFRRPSEDPESPSGKSPTSPARTNSNSSGNNLSHVERTAV